jgi:hypothetical protein
VARSARTSGNVVAIVRHLGARCRRRGPTDLLLGEFVHPSEPQQGDPSPWLAGRGEVEHLTELAAEGRVAGDVGVAEGAQRRVGPGPLDRAAEDGHDEGIDVELADGVGGDVHGGERGHGREPSVGGQGPRA